MPRFKEAIVRPSKQGWYKLDKYGYPATYLGNSERWPPQTSKKEYQYWSIGTAPNGSKVWVWAEWPCDGHHLMHAYSYSEPIGLWNCFDCPGIGYAHYADGDRQPTSMKGLDPYA